MEHQVSACQVMQCGLQFYKALNSKNGNKNSPNNDQHDEDEKAVWSLSQTSSALVDADEYIPDLRSVSWAALANPAMPEEDTAQGV